MSKLVARTQPGLNMGSPNPTRARKKVARPSPTLTLLKSKNQSVKSCGENGAAETAEHFRGLQVGLRGCVEAAIGPQIPLEASGGL